MARNVDLSCFNSCKLTSQSVCQSATHVSQYSVSRIDQSVITLCVPREVAQSISQSLNLSSLFVCLAVCHFQLTISLVGVQVVNTQSLIQNPAVCYERALSRVL